MSDYSEKFKAWLDIRIGTNGLKTYSELASKVGVSRQSLYTWMKNPTKIKKYVLAGMMYILHVENSTLETLCETFGIE